jgi:glycosyltransferase EpsF
MIKVLHVTGAMNRGGAEVMLMDIYRNVDAFFQFDFLINYKKNKGIIKGDFDEEIKVKGGKLFYIQTQWDIGPFNYFKEFYKIAQVSKPDIVHIHMNAKSGIIALAAKKAGIKNIIVHSHADLKFRGRFISRLISTLELHFQKILISKYSNYYWACSKEAHLSLFYKNKINDTSSYIINNAVDVEAYQNISVNAIEKLKKEYNVTTNTTIFGNVGRIVRHKNVLFILDILNEYGKENPNFLFVFAGRADDSEYLNEIFEKAKKYNLQNKIIYLDVRDDVPTIMSSLDVFIAPALQEGFGLVAVEAQAAGIPCILYKGFPRTVDMNLGLVTFLETFDIAEWVAVCKSIKEKKTDFKQIANAIISKGFDSKSNTIMIQKFYKDMVNNE